MGVIMSEKIDNYISSRENQLQQRKYSNLVKIGLYDKVFTDDFNSSPEFPYSEYVSINGVNTLKHFKQVMPSFTDEEYTNIIKLHKYVDKHKFSSPLSSFMVFLGYFSIIIGIIVGLIECFTNNFPTGLAVWFSSIISGSFLLGVAKIINLCLEIRYNSNPYDNLYPDEVDLKKD